MRLIVPFRAVLRGVDVGDAEEPRRRHANRRQHQRHQHSGDDDAHRPAQADASVCFRRAVMRQRMLKSCAGCVRHGSVGASREAAVRSLRLRLLSDFGVRFAGVFPLLCCAGWRSCGSEQRGMKTGESCDCPLDCFGVHPTVSSLSRRLGFPISLDAAFIGLVGENQKKRKRAKMPRFPLIEQISRRF